MKDKIVGYENNHRHCCQGSLLDGYATVEEYAAYSSTVNQKFLTITDHGMMSAVPSQIKLAEEYGLSPIFGCFPKGQKVFTKDGIKCIQDIVVGDIVLTHLGRYRKVLRTFAKPYVGDMVHVQDINNNVVQLTPEHPIFINEYQRLNSSWVSSKKWIKAGDMKDGRRGGRVGNYSWNSYVCFPKEKTENKDVYILDIKEILNKNFNFEKGYAKKEYSTRQLAEWPCFGNKLTIDFDFARFIGLFVAEGSFSINGKGLLSGGLRLTFNIKETSYIEFVQEFLKNKFKIESVIHLYPDKGSVDLTFNCSPFAYLLEYLCGRGARNKKVPFFVYESSMSIKMAFLQGLLEGDGKKVENITNLSKQATLKVSSENLAWGTRRLLMSFNIWASVSTVAEPNSFSKDGRQLIAYSVAISPEVKYRRSTSDQDYVYKAIRKTWTTKYSGEVYNFEVEEDNSYCVDFAVHNCELYLNPQQIEVDRGTTKMSDYVKSLPEDQKATIRKSYHLLAIAYNAEGYKNLVKLSSWGWVKGFYYKPRINHEMLLKHKEGLIVTSGCYNSEIGQAFDKHGEEAAMLMVEKYYGWFGKNFYLEIMLLDFKKQRAYNKFLIKCHEKYGIPITVSQDCHYCKKEDSKMQQIMLMIEKGSTMADIQKSAMENEELFELQDTNLWMKSEEEINQKWESDYCFDIPWEILTEAKLNSVRICEKAKGVELTIDRSTKLPEIPNSEEILKENIMKGFNKRGLPKTKEYLDRIKEEYELIKDKGFTSYFLIQQMMTDEARRYWREDLKNDPREDPVGRGRGSAVGSLICYCLGITSVNPIKHDLLFSRFLSPARGGKSAKLRFTSLEGTISR